MRSRRDSRSRTASAAAASASDDRRASARTRSGRARSRADRRSQPSAGSRRRGARRRRATLAMAAYVMALRGKPDASLDARVFAVRNGLPKWGQAFLLRAMAHAKADAAQIAELEQLVAANVEVKAG